MTTEHKSAGKIIYVYSTMIIVDMTSGDCNPIYATREDTGLGKGVIQVIVNY